MNRPIRSALGIAAMMLFCTSAFASQTPVSGSFKGCQAAGVPAQNTNTLKNRATQVSAPITTTIAELNALPATGSKVTKLRTEGVEAEGFLLMRRQEGKESCNCGDAKLNDFHIWMADAATDSRKKSAVVEMTPRWRDVNPGWTLDALQHLIDQKAKVRVTGWRYLDPNHQDQVGVTRASRWEIHPITKIEVFDNGSWREL